MTTIVHYFINYNINDNNERKEKETTPLIKIDV